MNKKYIFSGRCASIGEAHPALWSDLKKAAARRESPACIGTSHDTYDVFEAASGPALPQRSALTSCWIRLTARTSSLSSFIFLLKDIVVHMVIFTLVL